MDDGEKRIDTQVSDVVRGFMRLWAKFGAVLPQELASIREKLEGLSTEGELHPDTNYELFYRLSSQLYPEGRMTMGEVSNALAVPLSTATRIVDVLVERGYVQRIQDRVDRRVVRVELTWTGKELHNAIEGHIIQRTRRLLSALSEAEREEIFSLVHKIGSIMSKVIR